MPVPQIVPVAEQVLDEIKKLQAIIANAATFVNTIMTEDIEPPVQEGAGPAAEAEYLRKTKVINDRIAAQLVQVSVMEELLIQLQAETSPSSIVGLNLRVKNTLKIQS